MNIYDDLYANISNMNHEVITAVGKFKEACEDTDKWLESLREISEEMVIKYRERKEVTPLPHLSTDKIENECIGIQNTTRVKRAASKVATSKITQFAHLKLNTKIRRPKVIDKENLPVYIDSSMAYIDKPEKSLKEHKTLHDISNKPITALNCLHDTDFLKNTDTKFNDKEMNRQSRTTCASVLKQLEDDQKKKLKSSESNQKLVEEHDTIITNVLTKFVETMELNFISPRNGFIPPKNAILVDSSSKKEIDIRETFHKTVIQRETSTVQNHPWRDIDTKPDVKVLTTLPDHRVLAKEETKDVEKEDFHRAGPEKCTNMNYTFALNTKNETFPSVFEWDEHFKDKTMNMSVNFKKSVVATIKELPKTIKKLRTKNPSSREDNQNGELENVEKEEKLKRKKIATLPGGDENEDKQMQIEKIHKKKSTSLHCEQMKRKENQPEKTSSELENSHIQNGQTNEVPKLQIKKQHKEYIGETLGKRRSWCNKELLHPQLRSQRYVPKNFIQTLFSMKPRTPDLREIFLEIDEYRVQRHSSAIWKSPLSREDSYTN